MPGMKPVFTDGRWQLAQPTFRNSASPCRTAGTLEVATGRDAQ